MKIAAFFKNLYTNIRHGVSRFIVAFICSVLGFLTASFEIIAETGKDHIIVPLCMTFALVAIISVLIKISQEYVFEKMKTGIQYAICILTATVSFPLIYMHYESLYTIMVYTGIEIAAVCFMFFILMRGENRDTAFPKLVSSLVFTTAISTILSIGLSISIGALEILIFSWNGSYKIYLVVNLFVWVICFINIFLSLLPKKDYEIHTSKTFRIFTLFAALPIYSLLIVILLVYLAKIVITHNMPVGEINWFASFASLFFIFLLMSVMQYTEKAAKLFVKYGGYFLIPVLIMQAIAVFERINAYGLTTPRTVSLILIIISTLFIIGSIVIPKHLNKIALLSGIIVLIATVTPFNIIDLPIASQTKILRTTLEANDMIQNGVVTPNENVSNEDAEKILSAYTYLKYDAKQVPEFIPDQNMTLIEIFGFEHTSSYYDKNYTYCYYRTKDSVDISAYTKMTKASYHDDDSIMVELDGVQTNVDLKQLAYSLYEQYGENADNLDLYTIDENSALYFNDLSCGMEDEEITWCSFDGYVLTK